MTGGLYNSGNAKGLPPAAEGVPEGFEEPRSYGDGLYGRPLGEETIAGPVAPPSAGVPLLDQEALPFQEMPAPAQTPEPEPASGGGGGLLRSSAIMAVGTLASRVTGFMRTVLLAAALGGHALANVFNTANTIPNIVYDILLGGVLTAAHVPLLIRARNRSEKYGEEFEQRLFTLLLGVLALITAVAMAAAPWLIDLYGGKFTETQHSVAVLFLLFFLPQIFFYGFAAVAGASLNSRSRFGAPMWTPVLNNIVVIGVLGAFMAMTHGDNSLTADTISHGQVTFLGIGVTAGVAAQAIGLIPSMKRLGFNFRPRFDFRRTELTAMWGMASWTLVYVVAQQVALLVYTNLLNAAGSRGDAEHLKAGVGLTPWTYAYAFFQLPFAVVAISVITAILPRMTQSAAEGRLDRMATELREGLRLSLALMLPAVAVLFGAAGEICLVLFAHGSFQPADAAVMAQILRVFAIALTPFTVLQLLQRGFYALSDTKTPAFVAIFSTAAGAISAFVLAHVLSTPHVVLGIAAAQGVSWTLGCLVSVVLLRRRVGRLGGREILTLVAKAGLCSLAALAVAQILHTLVGPHVADSFLLSALLLVVQCGLAFGAYLACAIVVRVPEVNQVVGMVRRKIGR